MFLLLLLLLMLLLLLLQLLLCLHIGIEVGGPDGLAVYLVGAHFVSHDLLETVVTHADLLVLVTSHIPVIGAACTTHQPINIIINKDILYFTIHSSYSDGAFSR